MSVHYNVVQSSMRAVSKNSKDHHTLLTSEYSSVLSCVLFGTCSLSFRVFLLLFLFKGASCDNELSAPEITLCSTKFVPVTPRLAVIALEDCAASTLDSVLFVACDC